MRYTVYRFITDFEDEEKWLNEMAKTGKAMAAYSFCKYSFVDCEPGEYIYRIAYVENAKTNPKSAEYIELIKDSGAEAVDIYANRWVYFRKKAALGPFELYSDLDSRIAHYQSIASMTLAAALCEALILASQIIGLVLSLRDGTLWGVYAFTICFILACGILLAYVYRNYKRKIVALTKEREIHE